MEIFYGDIDPDLHRISMRIWSEISSVVRTNLPCEVLRSIARGIPP